MSIFTKFWALITGAAHAVEFNYAKVVVAVLQEVKVAMKTGVVGFVANTLDELTKSKIPTEIVDGINKFLPAALSTALAIQAPPATADPATILAWEKTVLDAWNIHDDKSKIYSVVGADLLGIINKKNQTFAQRIKDLDKTYQDAVAATTDDQATVTEDDTTA